MRVINNQLHEDLHLPNEMYCPHCNAIMNTATSPESGCEDGDYGVCAGCGEILICLVNEHNRFSLRKIEQIDIIHAKVIGIYNKLIEYQTMIRTTDHGLKVKNKTDDDKIIF